MLRTRHTLQEEETQFYLANAILGLEHVHKLDIVWRDLKPENFVIASDGYLKMVDLGFAKQLDTHGWTYTFCGTSDYMAPEIVRQEGHNLCVDYWSLGVMLYEMLFGATPYHDTESNVFNIFEQITTKPLRFPAEAAVSEQAKQLIMALLQIEPADRLGNPSIGEVRDHPWLGQIDWECLSKHEVIAPMTPQVVQQAKYFKTYDQFKQSLQNKFEKCEKWKPLLP